MVRLTWPTPTRFDLSVQVVDELLRSAGDAVCLALGLANGLLEQLLIDAVALARELPLPTKDCCELAMGCKSALSR